MPVATHDPAIDPTQLEAWDLAHLWHPFTQQDEWEADAPPLVIDRAEGVELIDVHGRRYLDGVSSLWTNVHGHRVPRIDAAVRAQLDRVAHSTLLGLAGTPSILLARRLVELAERHLPHAGLSRVFYSDSGSTAVEVALKMAFQWQQQRGQTSRTRFAALDQAYHGDTIGSVSVGGIDLFHAIYRPMLFDAVRLPSPERAEPEEEAACLARAEALLAAHGPTLAAVVVEPLVQGAAGMRMHSPAFLRRLLSLARAQGALVVVDEVATGFGRTGSMFAMEQVGPLDPCALPGGGPDLLCLAKGLTGGYLPLAATMVGEHVFDGFRGPYTDLRTLFHGHTYTGNPLGCAAALGSLEQFDQDRLLDRLPGRIAALGQAMATVPDRHVAERRQRGLMAGLLLRHDRPPRDRVAHRVCMATRRHGAIVRPLGDLVVLVPPLAMDEPTLARLVAAVAAGIADVLG
ncbi:adenosylmethionine--8-amino-7-oxononanoate transaminase [Myxococcota bacterium]|nr:adenosylmethionine--8-amino-7-oxononanoate transaminase [Myxococcota bacterium]